MKQSTQYLVGEKGEEVKKWYKENYKKIPKLNKPNRSEKIKFAKMMKNINNSRKKLQQKEIEYNRRKLSTAIIKI